MIRRFNPLLAVLSVVVLVTVTACSGSSATQAPKLTDPKDIVVKGLASLQNVKAIHLSATLTGSFSADLTGSGTASALKLDGTSAQGDIDIGGKKAHLTFSVPAFLGLTGEVITIGNDAWFKTSMTGAKWTHSTTTSATASAAVDTDPQKALADLRSSLDKATDLSPTLVGTASCGSASCYHVKLTITPNAITSALGSAAPIASADLSSFSGAVDLWVETGSERLVKAELKVDGGTQGSVDVVLNLSDFDKIPTISAPPADQVTEGTTG